MLELRPLDGRDVSLVERWLHKEHVKRWYEIPHLGVSIDDWMTEIKERDGAFHWLTHLIASYRGEPVGFCQYYRGADSGEDFGSLPLAGTYGIDYLIGEEACLGRGLGKRMIAALADRIFSLPDALRITADIDENNRASRHALLSCGFVLFDPAQSRYVLDKTPAP